MSPLHDQFLEVLPVGSHAWRVCDRRMDPSDARRVLGFVEERHNRFELLRLGGAATGRDRFDCLDAALADLGAGLVAGGASPRGGASKRAGEARRVQARCRPGGGAA